MEGWHNSHYTNPAWRIYSFYGGQGWIRTTEGITSRFTVCPIWPLWYLPLYANYSLALRADGGIRTLDPEITNHVLWPTELHRQSISINPTFRKGIANIAKFSESAKYFIKILRFLHRFPSNLFRLPLSGQTAGRDVRTHPEFPGRSPGFPGLQTGGARRLHHRALRQGSRPPP